MSLLKYIRETTALSGPLADRLAAELGERRPRFQRNFSAESLVRDVVQAEEVDIGCVDTRFQIWNLLSAFDGEVAPLPEPGVMIDAVQIRHKLNLLFNKFPTIQRINLFPHTGCGAMQDEIKYHQSGKRADSVAGALAGSKLAMPQLQILYAMHCALESTINVAGIASVAGKVQGGTMDLVPAFIASTLESASGDKKSYRDRIAPFDFEQARFILPQNRDHLQEILGRNIPGNDRLGAINEALERGRKTYEEAIRESNSDLVITI